MKKHVVQLADEVRGKLQELIREEAQPERILRRARILLKADEGLTDEHIAARFAVSRLGGVRAEPILSARAGTGTVRCAPFWKAPSILANAAATSDCAGMWQTPGGPQAMDGGTAVSAGHGAESR